MLPPMNREEDDFQLNKPLNDDKSVAEEIRLLLEEPESYRSTRERIGYIRKIVLSLLDSDRPDFELLQEYMTTWQKEARNIPIKDLSLAQAAGIKNVKSRKEAIKAYLLEQSVDPIASILANPKSVLDLFPENRDMILSSLRKELAKRLRKVDEKTGSSLLTYSIENTILNQENKPTANGNLRKAVSKAQSSVEYRANSSNRYDSLDPASAREVSQTLSQLDTVVQMQQSMLENGEATASPKRRIFACAGREFKYMDELDTSKARERNTLKRLNAVLESEENKAKVSSDVDLYFVETSKDPYVADLWTYDDIEKYVRWYNGYEEDREEEPPGNDGLRTRMSRDISLAMVNLMDH